MGAPSCDPYGNANGYSRDDDDGISCGSLGYARTDAEFADKVIIITNNIVSYPNAPWAIPEHDVDYVVRVDDIGDPKGHHERRNAVHKGSQGAADCKNGCKCC